MKKQGGKAEVKQAQVINFQNPENNRFLAIKELMMIIWKKKLYPRSINPSP